jgi:hypothetical protein
MAISECFDDIAMTISARKSILNPAQTIEAYLNASMTTRLKRHNQEHTEKNWNS